jgi:DNA-binding transcriptional LysR family regulator
MPSLSAAMSRLRMRHLQLLDGLDRLGSLRQVALELGIKQPAALSLINDLEFAIGVPLVKRDRSGTHLTDAARVMLARGRVALQEVALGQDLARGRGSGGGRLRIGASPYLINALLPEVVAQFRAVRPGVALDIREGTLDALVAELEKGELDALLGSVDRTVVRASEPPLEAINLVAEPLCVVAGRGHPLFAQPQATLDEVLAGPWALPHVSSHLRGLLDNAVLACGAPPVAPAVECRGIHNLLALAATAGLLTTAPRSEIARRRWRGLAVEVHSPLRLLGPPYVFVSRRYAQPVPEVVTLRELSCAAAQRLFGPRKPPPGARLQAL